MRPNLRAGMLMAAAVGGVLLAGCEANGGGQPGGGGGGGGGGSGFEHCLFPFGPGSVVNTAKTDNCLNCSIDNPQNLIDSDPATFATINVTSLLGGAAVINAEFEDPFNPDPSGPKWPAGNIAGYVVEFPGVVDASVLPTFSIVTKLDNVLQEEFQFSGVVGAELLSQVPSSGPFFLGVTTHKDFDFVEFKVTTGVASVLNTVNLYAACGNGDEQTTLPYNIVGGTGP